jgi:hypothetical protein
MPRFEKISPFTAGHSSESGEGFGGGLDSILSLNGRELGDGSDQRARGRVVNVERFAGLRGLPSPFYESL